jgi:hypothetical protein
MPFMMQTEKSTEKPATNTAETALTGFAHAAPLDASRRIGSTVYELEVYVKKDAGETIEEKIMRLIKNDLNPAPGCGRMDMPQTGRLPERIPA